MFSSSSSAVNPSLSHLRFDFALGFLELTGRRAGDSSPDEVGAELEFRALRALLEPLPAGPPFPVRIWFTAGEEGRDVSGVGMGVASAEVVSE